MGIRFWEMDKNIQNWWVYEYFCCWLYVGETSINFQKWIYEQNLKKANIDNSLVRHHLVSNDNVNPRDSKMLIYMHNKKCWKIVESVVFWPFDPAKNAIQGDAPEGRDTF